MVCYNMCLIVKPLAKFLRVTKGLENYDVNMLIIPLGLQK